MSWFKKEVRLASGDLVTIPDFAGWFIAVGAVVFAVIGWFAMGQPGMAMKDGDYVCSARNFDVFEIQSEVPAATVRGGELVEVWDFDASFDLGAANVLETVQTEKTSLRWSDFERMDRKKFTVTSQHPRLRDQTARFVCKWSSPPG